MKRRHFLTYLCALLIAGCSTQEQPRKQVKPPIHQVDHARYQYHSADSGSGYILGQDKDGEPIYGRRRTPEEEKWWRDSHDEYLKSK